MLNDDTVWPFVEGCMAWHHESAVSAYDLAGYVDVDTMPGLAEQIRVAYGKAEAVEPENDADAEAKVEVLAALAAMADYFESGYDRGSAVRGQATKLEDAAVAVDGDDDVALLSLCVNSMFDTVKSVVDSGDSGIGADGVKALRMMLSQVALASVPLPSLQLSWVDA